MTDQEILNLYRPMVKFLASFCGPSCEVVLHDVSSPNDSVIEIENGWHSGRTVGSPLTDLSYKIIEDGEYKTHDFYANYNGSGKGKNFISSTYFIKNENRLIGLLCINRDTSVMKELNTVFEKMKQQYNLSDLSDEGVQESLDMPIPQLMQNMVASSIDECGIAIDHMTINDKVGIVHRLMEQGVTSLKGSISEIARQLNISEPTVYRYMNR